jgi:hypothetical protein
MASHRHRFRIAIILFCVVGVVLIVVTTHAIDFVFRAMGDTVLRILGTLASAAFNALRHL